MTIKLINKIGKAYKLHVNTNTSKRLNDEGQLTFEILENESNYDVIKSISKFWTITNVNGINDIEEYKIILIDRDSIGTRQRVSVVAREKHLDDLMAQRIHDSYTGSLTDDRYFEIVFEDTGYKFTISQNVGSSRWENLGEGDSRFEMFQDGLKRYGLEYEYNPKTKTYALRPSVQNEVKYYISTKINANNLKIEEDASEGYTWIQGFGDFEENSKYQDAFLQVKYVHPLADVIGMREAPPVIDGRITKESTMKARLEEVIDNSIKVSLSLDFISLREEFPSAIPRVGDVVPIRDDVTDVFDSVRIIEVTTVRDVNNEIIKQDVVLGEFRRRDRYRKSTNKASKAISKIESSGGLGGLGGGLAKTINNVTSKVDALNYSTRDIIDMANSLNANAEGISAGDDTNRVYFNSDGSIQKSNDGGETKQTIIDSNGINEDALPKVSESQNGLMLKDDKKKLNQLDISKQLTTEQVDNINKVSVISEKQTDLENSVGIIDEKQTNLENALEGYMGTTDWVSYAGSVVSGVEVDVMYTNYNGLKCALKEVRIGIEGVTPVVRYKTIAYNLRGFKLGEQVAQLPSGFIKNAQLFPAFGNGNMSSYRIEIMPDGKMTILGGTNDKTLSPNSYWVYGQHTWIE
ncbi:phage tail protein [Mammaliicoccus sp. P-M59]|uniref:phage tail protein n=1 Tax=Mammaliicoccus sp. P-M59 TaxID=2898718 RepID=UPI001EFA2DDB|nr:phage tail protein [Mammaliicoccus sp. P-M59]